MEVLNRNRKIICLCGSTKFKKEFELVALVESLAGHIVLSVGAFGHADKVELTTTEKTNLDALHLDKIAMSDLIIIIDVGGYIGDSTRKEISFALKENKSIRYYSDFEHLYNEMKDIGYRTANSHSQSVNEFQFDVGQS